MLFCTLTAWGQQFNFQNFSVGDGLAQSQVFALIEDSRGYLWMGTRGGGLSRYDGQGFRTYTTKDGLINNNIYTVFEDAAGHLWVGTNRGLSRFNGIDFENFRLGNDSITYVVTSVLQDQSGTYWLGTDHGLFRYDQDEFDAFFTKEPVVTGRISCILDDGQGKVWAGHNRGVTAISDQKLEVFSTEEGMPHNLVECLTLAPDSSIWAGTHGGGIAVIKDSLIKTIEPGQRRDERIILSIITDINGAIWAATIGSGVFCWQPNDSIPIHLTESDGLSNNHVRSLLEDSWGNLWMGTSGGGVSRYAGQQFNHRDHLNGLPGKYIYSVMEDSQRNLWVGTSGLGVTRIHGAEVTTFRADSGFANVKVKAIFEDCDGALWFGTEGAGVVKFENDTFISYTQATALTDGLSDSWVRDIAQDVKDDLWMATAGNGITRMRPLDSAKTQFGFTHFTRSSGMPTNRVSCLHADQHDRIWFGTLSNGIGFIQNDQIYPSIGPLGLQQSRVRSMVEDQHGYLWVATEERGVYGIALYADSLLSLNFNTDDGLTSNNLYSLVADAEHNLWLGSEAGLDRLNLDDSRQLLEAKHYGKAEGFVGIETTQGAAHMDANNSLWFGTINGLTQYSPGSNQKNSIPPKLHLHEVTLFYESLHHTAYANWAKDWGGLRQGLELPHHENHLGFDFLGINLKNPDKVMYQWKMQGLEESWSPPSHKSDVTYSSLQPGKYTFLLKASNEDGVWTPEPISISFSILPPLWDTWWFKTGFAASVLLIVLIVFRLRLGQIKRKEALQQQRLRMEKDLLDLEQKALRLQMNPHFIFHALNSIQGQINQKDEKTARYFLAKFSRLMRMILENSRNTTIPLSDELQTLENYLSLEQFSRGNSFDFDIEVDSGMDPEEFEIPPMMIQPFIENAIIHGVGHLTERGSINVLFQLEKGYLKCTITDNGVGREKAATIRSQVDQLHKSTALIVTQERLDRLNLQTSDHNSLEIIDLKDTDDRAAGTQVVMRIPLSITTDI